LQINGKQAEMKVLPPPWTVLPRTEIAGILD